MNTEDLQDIINDLEDELEKERSRSSRIEDELFDLKKDLKVRLQDAFSFLREIERLL